MFPPFFHLFLFFLFNDTATTEIYTLSLHDALPILDQLQQLDGELDVAYAADTALQLIGAGDEAFGARLHGADLADRVAAQRLRMHERPGRLPEGGGEGGVAGGGPGLGPRPAP